MVVNSCFSPSLDEKWVMRDDAHELRAAAGVIIRRVPNRFWFGVVAKALVKFAARLDATADGMAPYDA